MSETLKKNLRLLKDYIESNNNQIKELQEQNAELVDVLEYIFYKTNFQNHFPTTSIKVKNLLTKHNHLKSNTNVNTHTQDGGQEG